MASGGRSVRAWEIGNANSSFIVMPAVGRWPSPIWWSVIMNGAGGRRYWRCGNNGQQSEQRGHLDDACNDTTPSPHHRAMLPESSCTFPLPVRITWSAEPAPPTTTPLIAHSTGQILDLPPTGSACILQHELFRFHHQFYTRSPELRPWLMFARCTVWNRVVLGVLY